MGITQTYINSLNIDADTLDGVDSTQFLRNDADSTLTAGIKISSSDGHPLLHVSGNESYLGSINRANLTLASANVPV